MRDGQAQPIIIALPDEVPAAVLIGKNVRVDVSALSGAEAKVGAREHIPISRTAVIGDI